MFVFLNGKFVKSEKACVSVFDHGFLFGDGVYETIRTYGGKICQLDDHLRRLKRSADLLKLKYTLSTTKIEKVLLKLIKLNGFKEARIRITVTRGINGMDFSTCGRPTVCIAMWELKEEPQVVYRKGVDIVTVNASRIFPEAKTISLLPLVIGQQEAKKRKAFEAVFVDANGFVREGTMTNIFIVKKGVVMTPKTGILKGTVRDVLIAAARRRGIKLIVKDFKIKHLYEADEAFITNAPRGVIPIKKADGKKVGACSPGTVTKKIMAAYKDSLEAMC